MSDLISTDSPFSPTQKRALEILVNLMIPAQGDMPSAADPEIFARTLQSLSASDSIVADALAALADIIDSAPKHSATTPATWHQNPSTQRSVQRTTQQIAQQIGVQQPAFLQVLQASVASSYYQDDRVLGALGLPSGPPHPGGHAVAATDWSLLDPVRQRKPFYRLVDKDDV